VAIGFPSSEGVVLRRPRAVGGGAAARPVTPVAPGWREGEAVGWQRRLAVSTATKGWRGGHTPSPVAPPARLTRRCRPGPSTPQRDGNIGCTAGRTCCASPAGCGSRTLLYLLMRSRGVAIPSVMFLRQTPGGYMAVFTPTAGEHMRARGGARGGRRRLQGG